MLPKRYFFFFPSSSQEGLGDPHLQSLSLVAQWLRCCAKNRKVAGSIPDDVIEIFHWHNSSDRTMALGWTQPLTEMSTRRISIGGKCGRCVSLTILPPSCAVVMKSGNINFLEPSGPIQACNGTALPLPNISYLCEWPIFTDLNTKMKSFISIS